MRQIILDTETTGLDPQEGHRVVEIGCVELINRRQSGAHFHVYINPERDMPEEALRIHGLSQDFLAQHPPFAAIASEFTAFVAGAEVIIHNAAFDVKFLNHEMRQLGLEPFSRVVAHVVDTLQMARNAFPGKRSSLDALCDRFAINRSNRSLHGALLDAQLLAEVYIALTRGQDSLLSEEGEAGGAQQRATVQHSAVQHVIECGATQQELEAHNRILGSIAKASKRQPLWPHRAGQPAAQPERA